MAEPWSFGAWLKQRRKALDLTQAELARLLGCATVTLQKIELDERRPSKELALALATQLGVPPDEREAFVQSARGQRATDRLLVAPPPDDASPWRSASRRAHTLPLPRDPLVGRDADRAAVCPAADIGRHRAGHADRSGRHRQDAPGAAGRRRPGECFPRWRGLRRAGGTGRPGAGALQHRPGARRPSAEWAADPRPTACGAAGPGPAAGVGQLRASGRGQFRRGNAAARGARADGAGHQPRTAAPAR